MLLKAKSGIFAQRAANLEMVGLACVVGSSFLAGFH